jgi:hypothetical protein
MRGVFDSITCQRAIPINRGGSGGTIADKNIAKTWWNCLLSLRGMNTEFPVDVLAPDDWVMF